VSNQQIVGASAQSTGFHAPRALRKWWIYQRERFPILTHGPLIAVFSFSTISFSAMARGHIQVPSAKAFVVAFASSFIFFLQLRIADEFKDFEEDAHYRPYRPVPRGLLTLRELGVAALAGGVVQFAFALWLSPALIPFLLLAWGYLALMSKEFFVRDWLKARPITYMWTHMLILPLVDLYGTACDWRVANVAPPAGLIPLLIVSFCNGFVLEIGRKVRAPEDEEHGVETYSFLWGRRRAISAWYGVLLVTAASALLAAFQIQFATQASALLAVLLAVAAVFGARFLRAPTSGRAKAIELTSGVWTLGMYLSLGALPLIFKLWEVRP
jgi:4-hydroxybenzoate polyprenyltransferase